MDPTQSASCIIDPTDPVLVTGAAGFIGPKLIETLLEKGLRNLRCIVRPHSDVTRIDALSARYGDGRRVEIMRGNLLSIDDCRAATADVRVIYHLAAGRGEKSFPEAFMNSVVTTRNLLEASVWHRSLRRFVNVSSFAVYSNAEKRRNRLLDETSGIEARPELRGDAYTFAKVKQDEIVEDYAKRFGIPYVIVRPGYVYGPGNPAISGRVGIASFGIFLHLGGSNKIPFTYVENCADAIALAGLRPQVDNEVFNVLDDDLPSSREFLQLYKRHVKPFKSIYLPHCVSYGLSYLWERYAAYSEGQLPPVYNRRKWNAFWRKTQYTNAKLKNRLGWTPRIPMKEGLTRYFESCRTGGRPA
jgi:nucleoside-diphosphate-sugar epimerase